MKINVFTKGIRNRGRFGHVILLAQNRRCLGRLHHNTGQHQRQSPYPKGCLKNIPIHMALREGDAPSICSTTSGSFDAPQQTSHRWASPRPRRVVLRAVPQWWTMENLIIHGTGNATVLRDNPSGISRRPWYNNVQVFRPANEWFLWLPNPSPAEPTFQSYGDNDHSPSSFQNSKFQHGMFQWARGAPTPKGNKWVGFLSRPPESIRLTVRGLCWISASWRWCWPIES